MVKRVYILPSAMLILCVLSGLTVLSTGKYYEAAFLTAMISAVFSLIFIIWFVIVKQGESGDKTEELDRVKELLKGYEKIIERVYFRILIFISEYDKIFRDAGRDKKQKLCPTCSEKIQALLDVIGKKEIRSFMDNVASLHRVRTVCLKIPYLNEILRSVIKNTEKATDTLIERFSTLLEDSNRAADEARKSKNAITKENYESLISDSKAAINDNKRLMDELISMNREVGNKFNEIDNKINGVYKSLKSIEEISALNKTIHINLSIEAVKLGNEGRGIRVIVNEIQKLHRQTADFVVKIYSVMKSFKDYNDQLISKIGDENRNMIDKIGTGSIQSEKIVNKLIDSYASMNSLVNELLDSNDRVVKNMSDIMESLQYQDITRQQIENVIQFLSEMQNSMENENRRVGLMSEHEREELIAGIENDIRLRSKAFDESIIINTRKMGGIL